MRSKGLLAALVLVISLTPGVGAAAPAVSHGCSDIRVPLRNFKVEAKWVKSTVRVGDTAHMKVLVTRTAEEDPITEEGHPYPTGRPMEEPAEDVVVGISMTVGYTFLNADGVTNAKGQADIKVHIKNYTRPGVGHSRLYAENQLTPRDFPSSACRVIVYEWGQLDPGPKLKVVR